MANKTQLLDYLASQKEAVLTYSASEMILAVHSNAGYLNEPKARSRAGGHFFLSFFFNNSNILSNNGTAQHCAHNQTCHIISARSGAGGTQHYGAIISLHPNHPGGNEAQTATNPDANRQLNGGKCNQ